MVENWLSATRQDCVRLCHLRPFGRSGVPLLSQLSMLDDLKRGMSQCAIGREYGVTNEFVHQRKKYGISRAVTGWDLPAGFELLLH